MDDFVEFYAACDPLLIPQAVQEIISHTRQQFGQVMQELLYEPDAHWFRCLTIRANKERIYQFLVQMMCKVAGEEINFTAEIGFEGMPFFNARTISWNDYSNCHEVQFKFNNEFIYPGAFASFPHRGVWEDFGACRLQTLSKLLNEFSCIFGSETLHQFSLATRCTVSHNLRGDVVFLMSHESMQNIQNGRRALDCLVDACNTGVQIAQDKASIYYHLLALTDAEQVSLRFTKMQDLGLLNKTCNVRVDPKRASSLRIVQLTGKEQKVTEEAAYPDAPVRTSERYYHEMMDCQLLPKNADIPGIFIHQSKTMRSDQVEPLTVSHRIDAWRNNVFPQSHSSFEEVETNSSTAPISDNHEDLIDLFSTTSDVQEPQKITETVVRSGVGSGTAVTTNDWLSDDPLMMESSTHLKPSTSLLPPQTASVIHPVERTARNMGARSAAVAAKLKILIRTLLMSPKATTLKLEIGRVYFASQPSRKADSLLSKSLIEKVLNESMGLPPISNYSNVLSTHLSDLSKVAHIRPSPSADWNPADTDVYYRISCTASGEKPFIIHLNASTLEFHCSIPDIPCMNAYIHCPMNAWDLSVKGLSQSIADEDLCGIARKAVSSMKIAHDSRGNPVIEVMDLTRFGGMINDITIRYSSTLRCNSLHDISMIMSWNQSMQRQKGFIRYEPSESAGNIWSWRVVPPQLSRQWLKVSFASDALNNILQSNSHSVLQESNARLDHLEAGGGLGSLCRTAIRMVSQMDDISPDTEQFSKLQKKLEGQAGLKRGVGSHEQNSDDEEEFW